MMIKFCIIYLLDIAFDIKVPSLIIFILIITTEVKPSKDHAGLTLEVPSEEILKKSS
ncbi:hypothetical protein Hanom_Chr15g01342821 [Helianthus anomalus]